MNNKNKKILLLTSVTALSAIYLSFNFQPNPQKNSITTETLSQPSGLTKPSMSSVKSVITQKHKPISIASDTPEAELSQVLAFTKQQTPYSNPPPTKHYRPSASQSLFS